MTHPAADPDALRAIVRETLMELLPELASRNGRPTAAGTDPRPGAVAAPDPGARALAAEPLRIERGALTEKLVIRAAKDGRRVVLGRRAVATPLALDKARSLGVDVERTD
jgi:hypothetical protein